MESLLNILGYWKEIAVSISLLLSIWAALPSLIKKKFTLIFKDKEAALSFDQKYEKFQEERMEKLLITIKHYKKVNDQLDDELIRQKETYRQHKNDFAAMEIQLREQKRLIDSYQEIVKHDRSALDKAKKVLKRFRIHIEYLERLLSRSNIEHEKIDLNTEL